MPLLAAGPSAPWALLHRAPDALGGGRHRHIGDAERGERVEDRAHGCRRRSDRAAFAHTLGAQRVGCAGDGACILRLQRSQVSRRRQDIGGAETAENWTHKRSPDAVPIAVLHVIQLPHEIAR